MPQGLPDPGDAATMKPLLFLPLAMLTGGCAAEVTHPTKSLAEMEIDIDQCSTAAKDRYWMDPIAALYNAYDCLEARGYQRANAEVKARVEKAVARVPAGNTGALPCRVPC